MPNWEAYAEAEKRGLLPPEKQSAYNEAKKRGLVPGVNVAPQQETFIDDHPEEVEKMAEAIMLSGSLDVPPDQAYDMHKALTEEMKNKDASFAEDVKTGIMGGIRLSGVLFGSIGSSIAGGIAGLTGMPKISTDPEKWIEFKPGLLTGGTLQEAEEIVTEVAGVPSGLIKTEEEQRVMELLDKIPELAGKGWQLIGEESIDLAIDARRVARGQDVDVSDLESARQVVVPLLGTMGEVSGEFAEFLPLAAGKAKSVINKTKGTDFYKSLTSQEKIDYANKVASKVEESPDLAESQVIEETAPPEADLSQIKEIEQAEAKAKKAEAKKPFETIKEFGKDVKDVAKKAGKVADEYLGAISTRLENINPKLKTQLRKFEFDSGMKKVESVKQVIPMAESVKKMTAEDRLKFDLARKNSDQVTIDAIAERYDMQESVQQTREILDQLHEEAKSVGIDMPYRENYHPRVLKDHEGFLEAVYQLEEWPVLERAIKQRETELGRYLEQQEKAQLINQVLTGRGRAGISQKKKRTVREVTPELNKFYMDSDAAVTKYINDLSDAISMRKFFGTGLKKGMEPSIDDTIGSYVEKLIDDGEISPNDESVLREVLSARFNEVGTSGIFSLYKNLSYIDTMGSPISAITQIGDLAFAAYKNGLQQTGKAFARAVKGKSKLKKEDLGIENIASEFSDKTKSSRAVERVFKAIGLEKMDNIGKETLINSEYNSLVKKASTKKGIEKLRQELGPIFEGETDAMIKDIQEGRISENVKLHLFNSLADFQPIALSEMPAKYLTGGNGRIFYMLKSFTLKQFDIYRREIFRKIKSPKTRSQGIKNLVALSAAFVAANATADQIKSFVLGRPVEFDDLVVDNMLRLFGISKFVTWKAREEGVGSAMVRQIAPPFKLADALSKDINTAGDEKGLETTASIPIVGKLYYWWFGKGRSKIEGQDELAN